MEEDEDERHDDDEDVDDDVGLWLLLFLGVGAFASAHLGDEVVNSARLKSFWTSCVLLCLELRTIRDEGECVSWDTGDEDSDEHMDWGRPPSFNDLGSIFWVLLFIMYDTCCCLVGVINVDLWDNGSMLIFTGTHEDDDVDDVDDVVDEDDKHDILLFVGALFAWLSVSFGSMFKWFMSSAEYLWQNEWLLCKLTWFVSESWSVKSLKLCAVLQIRFISLRLMSWLGVTDEDDDEEHADEEDEWEDVEEDLLRTFCTSCRIRPWPLLLQMLPLEVEPLELAQPIDFLDL